MTTTIATPARWRAEEQKGFYYWDGSLSTWSEDHRTDADDAKYISGNYYQTHTEAELWKGKPTSEPVFLSPEESSALDLYTITPPDYNGASLALVSMHNACSNNGSGRGTKECIENAMIRLSDSIAPEKPHGE